MDVNIFHTSWKLVITIIKAVIAIVSFSCVVKNRRNFEIYYIFV